MAEPTVSIAFVRSAVLALGAVARAQVLAAAGISPQLLLQDAARVPASAFARLWMAVARTLDDEFFGLDARRMKVGTFAMLCHALVGQPTVGQALRAALRGFGLVFDDLSATLRVSGETAAITLDNRIGQRLADPAQAADARRFADETLLVMLHGLLCFLAGRRVQPRRLDWAHPAPAHADEYRRMFGPLQVFDAPATALQLDARLLAATVAVDAAALKAFLRDAPQSVFLKQVAGGGLAEQLRRQLRLALARAEPTPTLTMLAAGLGLSAATLRRRLLAEGQGWQPLKDAVRRELALQWLAEGRLTVAAVAERLGFEDASTFYRAFRKWTGLAPRAWRGHRQATAPGPAGGLDLATDHEQSLHP